MFCFAGGRKKGVGMWWDKWFSVDLQMFLIIYCTSVGEEWDLSEAITINVKCHQPRVQE